MGCSQDGQQQDGVGGLLCPLRIILKRKYEKWSKTSLNSPLAALGPDRRSLRSDCKAQMVKQQKAPWAAGQTPWLWDVDETTARVCGCLGEETAPVEQDRHQLTSSLGRSPGLLLPVSGVPAGPLGRVRQGCGNKEKSH